MMTETIFENRFMHALGTELASAPSIEISGNTAMVKGRALLDGATVMALPTCAFGLSRRRRPGGATARP
ncbi:MAG: hypothetical protein M5R42_10180 [Rhodocyclaceae bacterium]|nr:hypothetical protein [Rhodocyclaceae bacterium]